MPYDWPKLHVGTANIGRYQNDRNTPSRQTVLTGHRAYKKKSALCPCAEPRTSRLHVPHALRQIDEQQTPRLLGPRPATAQMPWLRISVCNGLGVSGVVDHTHTGKVIDLEARDHNLHSSTQPRRSTADGAHDLGGPAHPTWASRSRLINYDTVHRITQSACIE